MSNYIKIVGNKEFYCIDNHFGPHKYGYVEVPNEARNVHRVDKWNYYDKKIDHYTLDEFNNYLMDFGYYDFGLNKTQKALDLENQDKEEKVIEEYFCYVEGNSLPRKIHTSYEEANKEAKRLCENERRKTYVLKIMGGYDISINEL